MLKKINVSTLYETEVLELRIVSHQNLDFLSKFRI